MTSRARLAAGIPHSRPTRDPNDAARKVAIDELTRLRRSIDNIDSAVTHILAERFKCTQQVGRLKAEYALPASDPNRERQQIERLRILAGEADLDPVFAEKCLGFVIAEVIRHHEAIAASSDTAVRRRRSGTGRVLP